MFVDFRILVRDEEHFEKKFEKFTKINELYYEDLEFNLILTKKV